MANELTKAMGDSARLVSLPDVVGHNDILRSGEMLWNVVMISWTLRRRLHDSRQRYL
jgi:hypothetical protein